MSVTVVVCLDSCGVQQKSCHKVMKRKISATFCQLLSLSCLLGLSELLGASRQTAQAQAATEEALPSRTFYAAGVSQYEFENGLKVLLLPDRRQSQIILNTTYLVGSRQEKSGERGYAHLVEHLLGRSTAQHPRIDLELNQRGIVDNYITMQDFTRYALTFTPHADLPANETLDWMLGLEADRMLNASLTPEDLEREKRIVINELITYESDSSKQLAYGVMREAYAQHSYGSPIGGLSDDIEAATAERVRAFYRTYYRPDNAVVILAGNFQVEPTLRSLQKHLGTLPRFAEPLPVSKVAEPTQRSAREVSLRGVGKSVLLCAGYHIPAQTHPDSAALAVAGAWLSGNAATNSTLPYLQVQKLELRDPGLMLFATAVAPSRNRTKTQRELLRVIESNLLKPTLEEIEQIKSSLLDALDRTPWTLNAWSEHTSNWAALGDWRYALEYRERLSQVTLADVLRVRAHYLRSINRTLGVFAPIENPEQVRIPPAPQKKIANFERFREEPKEDAAPTAIFDAAPQSLEKQVQRGSTAGFRWALLPQPTRGETVTAQMEIAPAQFAATTPQHKAWLRILAALLSRYGVSESEKLRLKATVTVDSVSGKLTLTLTTQRANFAQALGLVLESLQNPDWTAFNAAQEAVMSDIDGEEENLYRLINQEMRRYLTDAAEAGRTSYNSTAEEIALVRSINLAEVKAFYQSLKQESVGVLAVVGDFDAQSVPPALTQLGRNWKSQPRPSAIAEASPLAPFPLTRNERLLLTSTLTAFGVGIKLAAAKNDEDYPALLAGNYLFGDGNFLQSRLVARLREAEGLVYSIGTSLDIPDKVRGGSFTFRVLCAPRDVAYIEKTLREELAKVLREGFTEAELATAKVALISHLRLNRSDNEALAQHIAAATINGDTFEADALLEARINKLTPETLNAAFRRHLDPAKLLVFTINNTHQ